MGTAAAGDDSDTDGSGEHLRAKFDVSNELEELEKDLAFLEFIQSDEINNVEQFVQVIRFFYSKESNNFIFEFCKNMVFCFESSSGR